MAWPSSPLFLSFGFSFLFISCYHTLHFHPGTRQHSHLLVVYGPTQPVAESERDDIYCLPCVCGCSPPLAFVYVDLCSAPKVARTHGFSSIIINYPPPARHSAEPLLHLSLYPCPDIYFSALLTTATLIYFFLYANILFYFCYSSRCYYSVIITVIISRLLQPLILVSTIRDGYNLSS